MTATLVHISDIHFGNEDVHAIEAASAYIAEHKPDAVIASGDLTAVGSQKEMQAAFAWLRNLSAPVLATPGNHDTPYFDIMPRLFDPFGGFFRACEGVRTTVWTTDAFVIAPINTARGIQFRKNWALGAISGGQVKTVRQSFHDAPASALKIVVTHHPLVWPQTAPISGDTRGGPAALQALMEAGADLFLSGHLHLGDVGVIELAGRRAVAITAGTLSVRHRGEPGGFIAIRSDGAGRIACERMYAVGNQAVSAGVTEIDLTVP